MAADASNQALLDWAITKNIKVNGVRPANFSGRGRGIVAERKLNSGEELIFVPADNLVTVDSDCEFLASHLQQIRKCSVHGQIAAKFMLLVVLEDASPIHAWAGVLPTQSDIKSSMPSLWPTILWQQLPESARDILQKQANKMNRDLEILREFYFPNLRTRLVQTQEELEDLYRYAWMLANSRCFYWDYEYPHFTAALSRTKDYDLATARKQLARRRVYNRDRDDCMALCPVIDCFNHADDQNCEVTFTAKGFSVKASRDCEPGEELFVTYGKHSNDYLLVEYGFLLPNNPSDSTPLDSFFPGENSSKINARIQEVLESENLYRNYTLSQEGVCHRTQCAVRAATMSENRWREWFATEVEDQDETRAATTKLSNMLFELVGYCESHIEGVQKWEPPKKEAPDTVAVVEIKRTICARLLEIDKMARACLKMMGLAVETGREEHLGLPAV